MTERLFDPFKVGGTGWEPGPDEAGWPGDDTKDRCRACGRLRGSVEADYEVDGKRVTITESPDPCLGMLPGVNLACCAPRPPRRLGVHRRPRLQPERSGGCRKMRALGGDPPPQAFHLDPNDARRVMRARSADV
jgi:hypothetical protein